MRNGIESIRNPNVFRNKFMSRIRSIMEDAQTREELARAKRGGLNGYPTDNNWPRLRINIQQALSATPDDTRERKSKRFNSAQSYRML